MGLGVVLVFWAVVGVVLAAIGAAFLGLTTAFLTRGVLRWRRVAIISAALLPFACLAWGGVVFLFQAAVDEGLLHRDLGLGDGWHAPLPNGYQVSFIDVTDEGTVYNPKTQPGQDTVTDRPDAVFGVRLLQVEGPYLLGARDTHYLERIGQESDAIDSYFLLDTRAGKTISKSSYDELTADASRLGITLHLEPIYSVYSHFRFTWFDVFASCLLILPPLIAITILVIFVLRLRRTRKTASIS